MTWPVGKLEQLLKIKTLQRQLEELQSGRRSVVIHSYYQPVRADWELAYQQQRSGTLPIPPGTKLCWHDMRSGWMNTFTTAWDRENGTATSGEIYEYSQNQNSDYFRFIGNFDVAGFVRGAEDNTPTMHFGLDIGKRVTERCLALEIFFRVNMPVGAVTNYMYLNYGSLVTQVDLSGVLYRQITGGTSGTSSSTSSSQTQPYREGDFAARPTNATFENLMTIGRALILKPFASRKSDGRTDDAGQITVMVSMLTPLAAYAEATGPGLLNSGVAYRQFVGVSMRTINFDQYYRLFQTTSNVGADDNTARRGRGWAYAYFDTSMLSLQEYE